MAVIRLTRPSQSEGDSDRVLTQRVAQGDAGAARALAERIVPVAQKVARTLVYDRQERQDATQAALTEILASASSYSGSGSLEGWAYRIAFRVIVRRTRKERRRNAMTVLDEAGGDRKADTSPRLRLADDLPRPIEAYLAELKAVQREAFVLRFALGHTPHEIATLTEAPVATVKSRIAKAQSELRRLIQRDVNLGAQGRSPWTDDRGGSPRGTTNAGTR